MSAIHRRLFAVTLLIAAFLVVPEAKDATDAIRYTATATNIDPTVRLTAMSVDFVMDRWSTDAEHDRLFGALVEGGQDTLLKTLQQASTVGSIRTPDSLAYEIHYARRTPSPGGSERVILITDRYISLWEAANRPRTIDYPFTVIELRLNANGEGEGKLTVATKIMSDPFSKQIILENYGDQPVRLTDVKRASK